MKRVWGRVTAADGTKTWAMVTTDQNGYDDAVNVTWLAQVLKLVLGESPFWANWGIPQYQSIMSQIAPTYYVMQTQGFFSGKFAALSITQIQGARNPTYNINVLTQSGAQRIFQVAT